MRRVRSFIAIGANLGNATAAVLQAMQDIGRLAGTTVVQTSSLYSSVPVDSSGPDYVNAVIEVLTDLSATDLLAQMQQLEDLASRERPYRNAPRTLDLDILLYGQKTIDTPSLVVPHPRMNERAFVLLPLAEIAPKLVSQAQLQAVSGQSIRRIPG